MDKLCQGYEYITDSITGEILAIERATGAVYSTTTEQVIVGSTITTPEQKREHHRRNKRNKEIGMRRLVNDPLGKYYFIIAHEQFENIAPENVTRLIYLSTFMNYKENKLMLTERLPMKYEDLPAVLGVSKSTAWRFWREVNGSYISKTAEGLIFTNNTVFRRGNLHRNQFTQYQKIYIDGVRRLYLSVDKKYHRRLGEILKLLPFINLEYNILCRPECALESDISKIDTITVAEFCEWIGYDVAHLNDLLSAYREIRFNVNGRQERFCSLNYDGVNKKGAIICINPHILYCGSDYEKVEVLGAFYKE